MVQQKVDDDLPETWRRELDESRSARKRPERPPIQPIFSIWPWGLAAAGAPLAALYLVYVFSRGLHVPFPNWNAGAMFFAPLMFINGGLLSRAIGGTRHHLRFGFICAGVSVIGSCEFLIPGATELFLAFLAAHAMARCIGRIGFGAAMFFGIVLFTGCLMFPALVFFVKRTGLVLIPAAQEANVGLALALIAAYALAHALCTAALPAQPSLLGRLDAASSGISAALLGLFAGIIAYRSVGLALELAARWQHTNAVVFGEALAACCGLATGNAVCVWSLFSTAYSEREEVKDPALANAEIHPLPVMPRPKPEPVAVVKDIEFDDAT